LLWLLLALDPEKRRLKQDGEKNVSSNTASVKKVHLSNLIFVMFDFLRPKGIKKDVIGKELKPVSK
jgi:hypothetical protein